MANKKSTDTEPTGDPFFFPEHNITIYAKDRETAEEKLEAELKKQESNED